jgi:hypothetical protein
MSPELERLYAPDLRAEISALVLLLTWAGEEAPEPSISRASQAEQPDPPQNPVLPGVDYTPGAHPAAG